MSSTSAPKPRAAAATSSLSVATTTAVEERPRPVTRRHTHSSSGRPASGWSGLRGSRVEPSRAGMTPSAAVEAIGGAGGRGARA